MKVQDDPGRSELKIGFGSTRTTFCMGYCPNKWIRPIDMISKID